MSGAEVGSGDESGVGPEKQPTSENSASDGAPEGHDPGPGSGAPEESADETCLAAALRYAAGNVFVFPVHGIDAEGKCTCGRVCKKSPGKHPRTNSGFKDATTDEAQIRAWWSDWPDANVGIVTGRISGFWVLDIDPRNGGQASLEELEKKYFKLEGKQVATGGGGTHFYFRHERTGSKLKAGKEKLGPGIDVKADGGYVVAPPSKHASGGVYAWREGSGEFRNAPRWLLDLLREPKKERKPRLRLHQRCNSAVEALLEGVDEGGRNQAAASLAGHYLARGLSPEAVLEELRSWNKKNRPGPLADAEIRAVVASIAKREAEKQATGGSPRGRKVPPRDYSVDDDGTYRVEMEDEKVFLTPLLRFGASIVEEAVHDDGSGELRRTYIVRAVARAGEITKTCEVSADKFADLNWIETELGSQFIRCANAKAPEIVEAIKHVSQPKLVTYYEHVGWREIGGAWMYLHGGGAIGREGEVEGIITKLDGRLAAFWLRSPPEGQARTDAVRFALELFRLGPRPFSALLLGGVFRSTLGEAGSFSVLFKGSSGAFKTECAAVMQAFFGHAFHARSLPGSFNATDNALERIRFQMKDAVCVHDDFVPASGSKMSHERLQLQAERTFRGTANGASRDRCRADGSLRAPRPQRCLVVATGELGLSGHSLLARVLEVTLREGDVTSERLTIAQDRAAAGVYATAMAAWLQWLAGELSEVQKSFKSRAVELRNELHRGDGHRRTAAALGELIATWEIITAFAVDAGALTEEEACLLLVEARTGLLDLAEAQAAPQREEDPVQLFLSGLREALAAQRCYLDNVSPAGTSPGPYALAAGWRAFVDARKMERGFVPAEPRVGWIRPSDGEVWLIPAAAEKAAFSASGGLRITGRSLHERMREAGVLASIGSETKQLRLTVKAPRSTGASKTRCLHLKPGVLLEVETAALLPDRHQKQGAPQVEV